MAVLLLVVVGIGLWIYISYERNKNKSKQWLEFEDANTVAKLEEIAKKDPNLAVGRVAEMSVARSLLGPEGIDQLNATTQENRQKAIDNVEKAREMFTKLLSQFDKDPVFKAECLLGLAKAEAALIAVPVKPTDLTDYRGKMTKLVEYLDQLAATAAPDTPWATDSKKLADALRNEKAQTASDFVRIQRSLTNTTPILPKFDDPHAPGGPLPIGPKK
ncbi:MAG: hypothetical protein U0792_14155 [Gemmataceae bacterium]